MPPKSGHYPLTEDASLPPSFVKDLNDIIRLLVVTQGAEFYQDDGSFIANQLTPFIEKVRHLLVGTKGWDGVPTAQRESD